MRGLDRTNNRFLFSSFLLGEIAPPSKLTVNKHFPQLVFYFFFLNYFV